METQLIVGITLPNVTQVASNYFLLIPFVQAQANVREWGQCPFPFNSPLVGRQGSAVESQHGGHGMATAVTLLLFPIAALLL